MARLQNTFFNENENVIANLIRRQLKLEKKQLKLKKKYYDLKRKIKKQLNELLNENSIKKEKE